MGRIRTLDPLVARRIAAGEVVERPSSVVRELIDNAIDADPSRIILSLSGGGIDRIVVTDDGSGIAREDLPLCCASHATSKVRTLDDLYSIRTMGFRGEALYSISAVSRTTIESCQEGGIPSTITVDNGKSFPVTSGGPQKGTRVTVENLFGEIPARRQFLKRPSAEGQRCRSVFIEKALAEPGISFTLESDGEKIVDFPPTDRRGRVLQILALDNRIVPSEMLSLTVKGENWTIEAVTSSPALYRSDRSGIHIFVNNRPVEEFSLVQAVSYGYGEKIPGGAYPYSFVFIDDAPEMVDFNIHPTKREVKIRNKAEIHHGITVMLQNGIQTAVPRFVAGKQEDQSPTLFDNATAVQSGPSREAGHTGSAAPRFAKESGRPYAAGQALGETIQRPVDRAWFSKARAIMEDARENQAAAEKDSGGSWDALSGEERENFTYIGQAFHLFLVCEKGDSLYLIDQHAAHERVLFNAIKAKKDVQPLLVPLAFSVEKDVDDYLEKNLDIYLNLGISLTRTSPLSWKLTSVPALFKNIENEVVAYISTHTGDAEEVEKGLYAVVACHSAIKQGDPVDRTTAIQLIKDVFALEDPVCPHGRTFVIRLDKKELMQAVGRIV